MLKVETMKKFQLEDLIERETCKLSEIRDNPDSMTMAIKKTAGIGLKRPNEELKVRQESINHLKGSLTNQITGIKKTITKLLDKETSLAEKIRTLL